MLTPGVIRVLGLIVVVGESRFESCQGHLLDTSSWQVDLDIGLGPRLDAKGSFERLSERRIYAPPTYHDVGRGLEIAWNVDVGLAMG